MTSPSLPPTRKRASLIGAGLVFLSAVGFSLKAVLVKLAYVYAVDPVTLLALRMGFSLPFFLGAALWISRQQSRVRLETRDWLSVLILGLLGYYLASYLDFLGLQYVSAGLERLILFTYPTMVLLLSALLLKRAISGRDAVALLISYGGIGLAFAHDASLQQDGALWGALLIAGSALSYAIYMIGSGQAIARFGVAQFTAYAMTVSSVAVMLQFFAVHDLEMLVLPRRVYELALVMAIVSTVLPAFMLSAGIRRIGASQASLISAIGPISTIVLGHLLLSEPITLMQIAGTALVCAGTLIISGVFRR